MDELLKPLAQAITDTIETHDEFMDCNCDALHPTASRHVQFLATLIENALRRGHLGFKATCALFGAPGDWGYSSPIGKALQDLYKPIQENDSVTHDSVKNPAQKEN